ncbi:glycosyl transferase family 51 (plasmid) [Pseudarthrobacter chlorophenolicus A6]|uniref:Glycosyl transferase family 51 n=1 Tax=Pseudarthrobacter chlorophenolicus (strain ATCC 700700 / DSM 12829 / CIP 107037 / JCM 12360 / KCTC 9906 / NCIMB 13794 / A6) TaxID=452863 RepID=B8HIT6_PSECP|nr:transglycosylase domain-containing protein [Pseudarthrobacter chlorophenolicus]ACL42333.1 glycosyl transferase family 51 [Pseudarthrobacter chlorophenolicus A6]SDQ16625.1 Membrane carboxypeptidase (penicillin-binding protein) [Pseudarthrobacter chlorophenolicus]
MRRKHNELASVEQLLGSAMKDDPTPQQSLPSRLAGFVSAVLLVSLTGLLAAPVGAAASLGVSTAIGYWESLPSEIPLDVALPQHTVLLDRNGKEFARFFSENRVDVRLAQISPTFTEALLATEDARFYENGPIDFIGTMRATIVNNVRSNQPQGASGITQQLVKNLLVAQSGETSLPSRDLGTKLQELKYAAGLEEKLSKDQILEMYSNTVYFGNGAYGIEAAAKVYFNTTAKNLTRAQGATLAGILKGPGIYDPFTNAEGAIGRRNTALGRLETTGKITAEESAAAAAEPLGIIRGTLPNGCASSTYPFYCSLVRDEILTDPAFGATAEARAEKLSRGGMILTTALDPAAMTAAQGAVTTALGNDNRAALGTAVIKPGTGQIAAIAQNRDWGSDPGQTQLVYAKSAYPVGSSMKPIVLATALEQGIPATTKYNANSPYVSSLDNPVGGFINYNNISWGTVDARRAIQLSLNIYFIRLIERTGVLPVADMAAKLGITSLPRTGERAIQGQEAALALGAYDVSPIEMANAYAVFAGGGVACRPVAVTSGVRADTGTKIAAPDPDCHQAIAPAVANTVADALKMPFVGPDGTLAQMGGLPGREAGAKTGTTNDFAANWIVGIVPQYATAVWLGDPRGGQAFPLNKVHAYGRDYFNLTGSEVAAPVWKDIMTKLTAGLPAIPLPKADDAATSSSTARTVPDVRGLSVSEASTLLLENDLAPDVAEKTGDPNPLFAKDIVVSQTPAAGSTFSYREKVSLTLSQGSDTTIKLPERK